MGHAQKKERFKRGIKGSADKMRSPREDIPLAYARTDGRLAVLLRALDTAHVPREIEACRCVLLLVGFFFLQGLDMEIAADLCRDLVALHCAAEDVRILAAFDLQGVFRSNLRLLSISTTNH